MGLSESGIHSPWLFEQRRQFITIHWIRSGMIWKGSWTDSPTPQSAIMFFLFWKYRGVVYHHHLPVEVWANARITNRVCCSGSITLAQHKSCVKYFFQISLKSQSYGWMCHQHQLWFYLVCFSCLIAILCGTPLYNTMWLIYALAIKYSYGKWPQPQWVFPWKNVISWAICMFTRG